MLATTSDSQNLWQVVLKSSGFSGGLWKTPRASGIKLQFSPLEIVDRIKNCLQRNFHAKKLFFNRMAKKIVGGGQVLWPPFLW